MVELNEGLADVKPATEQVLIENASAPSDSGGLPAEGSQLFKGYCGIGSTSENYGLLGLRAEGVRKNIVMINAGTGSPVEVQSVPLFQKTVYFKTECDFTNKKDVANFFYSLDGKTWTHVGTQLKMAYTIPHIMGYRFALFNYATENNVGSADFDFFSIESNYYNQLNERTIKA